MYIFITADFQYNHIVHLKKWVSYILRKLLQLITILLLTSETEERNIIDN